VRRFFFIRRRHCSLTLGSLGQRQVPDQGVWLSGRLTSPSQAPIRGRLSHNWVASRQSREILGDRSEWMRVYAQLLRVRIEVAGGGGSCEPEIEIHRAARHDQFYQSISPESCTPRWLLYSWLGWDLESKLAGVLIPPPDVSTFIKIGLSLFKKIYKRDQYL
jgi:hypothetical protein